MKRQRTPSDDYPQAVIQQIRLLAENIITARKRRGETQAQWARKLGVSQPTMARIERGDPSVAMVSYVMCMWLINQATGLADLISPINDHASLEREVTKARSRRSATRSANQQAVDTSMVASPRMGGRAIGPSADNAANAAGLAALLSNTKPPGA